LVVCDPSVTVAASNVFGKQADVSTSDESSTGIHRQPHLKRPRHSMSAVMPVSSTDAKECPQERLPPAKFQRAVQQTSAWSNLVKVSTTSSFEGAKDLLCFIDPSYSRLHLFDDAFKAEVQSCPLDRITLRARKLDTDTAVVVTLHTTPATATSTLYLSRASVAPLSQARQSPPHVPSMATTSRVSVGTHTGTRGELLSRVLTHFLGSGTTYNSDSGSGVCCMP